MSKEINITEWPTTLTLMETHMGMRDACAVVTVNRDDEGVTITVETPEGHAYPESATIQRVY